MSGFVGFISREKNKNTIFKPMLNTIKHRGPDWNNKYIDTFAAIGGCYINLYKEPNFKPETIYNETGNLVLFCNGNIYNYKQLKQQLTKLGHVFKTDQNIEVIVHGYEQYGKDVVNHLRGMFSFVIWDIDTKQLFGARDHYGIKPFYYTKQKEAFIFGSEIKSFLSHPSFVKRLNKQALKPYLTFQYSVLEETFFEGVYKLKPGHYFTYKDSDLKTERYYEVIFDEHQLSWDQSVVELKNTLKESVEVHKDNCNSVSAFLSGGIDSSYITKISKPNKTISVGFENKNFNEVVEAKTLSKILNIDNVSQIITPKMFFEEIENIQYHSDEPHANLSSVPLYFLSKLAKGHTNIVLSGEGADELFGGYRTYEVRKYDLWYRSIPLIIRKPIGKLVKKFPEFHGRNFLMRNSLDLPDYYVGQAYIFDERQANNILNNEYKGLDCVKEIISDQLKNINNQNELTKKQYIDMQLWMPQDILLKADKMTMAHSLEVRMPFVDREVVKFATKIPQHFKIHNNVNKYILRQAAKDELPDEWVKRPKVGFPVPFSQWIKEEKYYNKINKLFNEQYVNQFFNQEKIIKLLNDHYCDKQNNGRKIWTIYTFLIWYKVYFIE